MRFEYFPETDTLFIALRPGPSADAVEVAPDVVLDYDGEGNVIGVTVEHARERTDLDSLQIAQFPALQRPAA